MFGINEILNKFFINKELSKQDKDKILRSKRIDLKVFNYLSRRLNNLHIEVSDQIKGTLFELMPVRRLDGWNWQTVKSAIVFFNDDDYIEIGTLKRDDRTREEFNHSWICFKFNHTEYVLDCGLDLLCKKSDYSKIFKTNVKETVYAKTVKDELINMYKIYQINKKIDEADEFYDFDESMELSDELFRMGKNTMDEYYDDMDYIQDINTPLYRYGVGYDPKIEHGRIKKLRVHFYDTDC